MLGQLWCVTQRDNKQQRDHGIRDHASTSGLQSICLRMKVGISMSLRSCDPLLGGGGCTDGRGARGRSLTGLAGDTLDTRAGRLAGKGITGAPLGTLTVLASCDAVT